MIKKVLLSLGLALSGLMAQASDIGVSVHIGQPGFYGRIDIGDVPRPRVIYAEPMIVQRAPRVVYEPVYLRVPPGHQKKWRHYCGRYDACGRPVYFVRDDWYREVYVPHYQRRHGERYDRRHDRDGWHDGDRRGHGRGHGHGHGHGRQDRD